MVSSRPYADAIGYGQVDHLCSYQGWFDAVASTGKITSAGLAWQLVTSYKLFARVYNPRRFRATHAYVMNGNVINGNWDIAVYTLQGKRVASVGSTAQSGSSQIQLAAMSGTIPEGPLLLTMQCSSLTAKFAYPSPSASFYPNSFYDMMGWGLDHTTGGGLPLPANITPVTGSGFGGTIQLPIFGILKRWPPA